MVILAKEFWKFELFRTFSYLMEFQFEFCRTFFKEKKKREIQIVSPFLTFFVLWGFLIFEAAAKY